MPSAECDCRGYVMGRRQLRRRGVLLLVVLSVLVLFVLAATTFLIVAARYRRGAEAVEHAEPTVDRGRREIESALYQLVRGTKNPHSSLFGHSLLGDLYGVDHFEGIVVAAAEDPRRQFTVIQFAPAGGTFSPIGSYYNGCVLTVLDGPARGVSTRVVGYSPGSFLVEPLHDSDGQRTLPRSQDRFWVNGRPFNGTGAGYNPATGRLDATLTGEPVPGGQPLALLPHLAKYAALGIGPDVVHIGGNDESWDAADYQNVFLGAPALGIPSFHRPALVDYWKTRHPSHWNDQDFRRLVVMRPLPDDHPRFTGGNHAIRPGVASAPGLVQGPWDVDNDGDGITDSVWLDLAAPVRSGRDGTLYKPLCAILCVDLDGRLNVNAHGNLAQLLPGYHAPATGTFAGGPGERSVELPRGRGFGTSEVHLSTVFGSEVMHLLKGRDHVPGRYGFDGLPGAPGVDDALSAIAVLSDWPGSTARGPLLSPDTYGVSSLGLDPLGYPLTDDFRPSFSITGSPLAEAMTDDPYELELTGGGSGWDRPFSLAEMERVLRFEDVDAQALPDRLLHLARQTFSDSVKPQEAARRRQSFTTHSFDVPAPNVVAHPEIRGPGKPMAHLADLMSHGLGQGSVAADQMAAELSKMLSTDLRDGQRLDVNRPFGNGYDDNDNGVVDEPGEAVAGEPAWSRGTKEATTTASSFPVAFQSVPFAHTNEDPVISEPRFARQIFARHLYCLMMLLVDRPEQQTTPEQREFAVARLAQWAINVVDFRDSDSIMTPFEYDVNPFDGWQPMDGNVATDEGGDRRVVWGCEYPELIITETLALHDRRLRDSENDSGPRKKRWAIEDGEEEEEADPDLDQYRIPEGALYLELYNTRGPVVGAHSDSPAELYDEDGRLDLGRLAPMGRGGVRYPVWRIAIGAVSSADLAVDRPESNRLEHGEQSIERIIWLAAHDPAGTEDEQRVYFARGPASAARLGRGHYAVVGPRPLGGMRPGIVVAAKPPSHWVNTARTASTGIGISVSEPLPDASYYPEPTIISRSGRVDAYGRPDSSASTLPDHPLDNQAGRPLAAGGLPTTGTQVDYKTAFLQRLADPLQAFHPQRNPYLTVDWAAIDLTVFNTEDRAPSGYPLDRLGPFDRPVFGVANLPLRFASRQRGRGDGNLWDPLAASPPESTPSDAPLALHLLQGPVHTLGRINSTLVSQGQVQPSADIYSNAPTLPYPWLTWNNRPFSSQYELMLVPSSAPSRLLHEFNLASHFGAPTGHLLDFFHRSTQGGTPEFFRILDYLEVPSRFVGTKKWYNPQSIQEAQLSSLRPPFNHLSRFREPGRININTIYDSAVWRGIAAGFPPMDSDAFWQRISRSREGYGGKPSSNFPTRLANPFRSAASADLMPLPQLQQAGVQATLLRSDPDDRSRPLMTADPATNPEVLQPHRNQNQNAYFYYQGLQRLGNVITTHSNVFAVWITVGYFQVQPHQVDSAHPDGYQLGPELGESSGSIRRHRGFFIVDRSIPVAFQEGENHNVDQAIVLRRFIE